MKGNKKLFIVNDHAGFEMKKFLISNLEKDCEIIDYGCNQNDENVNYALLGQEMILNFIKEGQLNFNFGIMICGSGIGMSIIANRYRKIRAALCFNEEYAKLARMHNDANTICLGARFINNESALRIVNVFLEKKFEGGRHLARVDILSNPKFY